MTRPCTVISLFCGCGGLDLGCEWAGFHVLWANDNNPHAVASYRANFPAVYVESGTIRKVDLASIPDADVLVGGYPCQGFSLGGARRLEDPRNALYVEYGRVLQAKRPKIFVAENVKGLLTMGRGEVIKQMVREFAEKGYRVQFKLLNAKDYGVAQDRERVFLVGIQDDLPLQFQFPPPTHGPNRPEPYVTLRDVLWDLRAAPSPWYDGHYTSRYMSRQRKRSWGDVGFCVQASAEQNALHPDGLPMRKVGKDLWEFVGDGNRRLSLEECKKIQSFPASFQITGPLKEQYKQVGNAVPPLLAKAVAVQVKLALEGNAQLNPAPAIAAQSKITDFL